MLIQSRINNAAEFKVQSNREDLTDQDKSRLNEIVQNAMNGNYEDNEGFSVSYRGSQNGNYSFNIKSDAFGDDLHSALENERELEKEAFLEEERENFENFNNMISEAVKEIDNMIETDNFSDYAMEGFNEGFNKGFNEGLNEGLKDNEFDFADTVKKEEQEISRD